VSLIKYTFIENSTKNDPFYLQNLTYDLPFETSHLKTLKIEIRVPKNFSVYIIDDLNFVNTKNNEINFILEESSTLYYQLFIANHNLCSMCSKRDSSVCQKLPENFEKKIDLNLIEENSKAYMKCHYLGDKTSSLKFCTKQNHKASNTTSKLVLKGVLDDEAKLSCNSIISVDKNLEKIKCEQINKNLILDGAPHVVSIPKLEINTQDVSCKHGATISHIDEEELFYLQSRGIKKVDAERILVEAFLR